MTSEPDKSSQFQSLEIKTSWGPIELTREGGSVTGCTLPFLKNTPRKPFAMDEFQTLENLPTKFPRFGTSEGTEFQKAVWKEMQKIPRGKTKTYGEIAAAIGRPNAVRAVGSACGANPIPLFIPCHRVVAKNGLGGFGSGLPWKKLLLEMEKWNEGTEE
jgi:O-6-methylguanine DNA methyltransferase